MLESSVTSLFSEVYKLVPLCVAISATVATARRSFPELNIVRTYLRSAMSEARLDDLRGTFVGNTEAKTTV